MTKPPEDDYTITLEFERREVSTKETRSSVAHRKAKRGFFRRQTHATPGFSGKVELSGLAFEQALCEAQLAVTKTGQEIDPPILSDDREHSTRYAVRARVSPLLAEHADKVVYALGFVTVGGAVLAFLNGSFAGLELMVHTDSVPQAGGAPETQLHETPASERNKSDDGQCREDSDKECRSSPMLVDDWSGAAQKAA